MPCSAKFSMTFQTEILSTETSDSLKRMIILKSFDSVLFEDEWMRMHVFFFVCFLFFCQPVCFTGRRKFQIGVHFQRKKFAA